MKITMGVDEAGPNHRPGGKPKETRFDSLSLSANQ